MSFKYWLGIIFALIIGFSLGAYSMIVIEKISPVVYACYDTIPHVEEPCYSVSPLGKTCYKRPQYKERDMCHSGWVMLDG